MDKKPGNVSLVAAEKAVRSEYIQGHTIIYRSNLVDNRWTKNIDDIVEIIDGEVPPEKASEIYKKFLKTVY